MLGDHEPFAAAHAFQQFRQMGFRIVNSNGSHCFTPDRPTDQFDETRIPGPKLSSNQIKQIRLSPLGMSAIIRYPYPQESPFARVNRSRPKAVLPRLGCPHAKKMIAFPATIDDNDLT
jgi:hypothetical protein